MTRKSLFVFIIILFSSILSLNFLYGANVDVVAYVYEDETIFNYIFIFDDSENYDKFSIEKPKDAKLDYVVDHNGPIAYEVVGDYYIFNPEETAGQTILLKYRSKLISTEIYTTQAFKTYLNFNFPVSLFEFKIDFKDNFGEMISLFPSDYEMLTSGKILWKSYNLSNDAVYIVNFKDNDELVVSKDTPYPNFYYIILSILILISILSLFGFIYQYTKRKNHLVDLEENGHSLSEKNVSKSGETIIKTKNSDADNLENSTSENVVAIKKKSIFNEIVEKHLTQNEKDVVMIVKDNEGIIQNDILDYLPNLSKSNLSKIISKLDSRKILKRIKVGKINNIYLGKKLDSNNGDLEKEEE